MKDEDLNSLKKLISEEKNIVIIPHSNPDGDAIGSALALMYTLDHLGHIVNVISPNVAPNFLKWIPGYDKILFYDTNKDYCDELILSSEIIFTLDFNDLTRVEEMKKSISLSEGKIVLIDHHQNPKDYADLIFSDEKIGSTCELLFEILNSIGLEQIIDSRIATCLYLGMMTDSGSFQYPSVTYRTHEIVSELIKKNIIVSEIYNNVYNNSSISKLKTLGCALESLTILREHKTVFMYLKKDDLQRFNFQKGDSEGIVNYGLNLKNIVFSVIFIEDLNMENTVKISFRSKGSFSCNEFAKQHFNGGGHFNAAGAKENDSLENTILKFKKIILNSNSIEK
ncbi:MAG: DHH family phosphoesterase [Flavobacteriaceae bacterium]|tara:strand:+ start:49 stop:1065 length:1017 start_codon:yes stop_codon:yes gene_type:complete